MNFSHVEICPCLNQANSNQSVKGEGEINEAFI